MNITLKTVVLAILAIVLFGSCKKDSADPIKDVSDQIYGTYNLKKILWEGEPVDVNNDGISSNNLYQELMDLPTNAGNKDNHLAHVSNFSENMQKATISIRLPLQNFSITHDGRYPEVWMIGNALTVFLSYYIDSEGTIQVERFVSHNLPESDSRIELKRMKNGTVLFDLEGHLTFRTEYTLYDRLTKKLVDGIIQYTYEKTDN